MMTAFNERVNGTWWREWWLVESNLKNLLPERKFLFTTVQSGKMTCMFLYISMSMDLESKNDYLYSKTN